MFRLHSWEVLISTRFSLMLRMSARKIFSRDWRDFIVHVSRLFSWQVLIDHQCTKFYCLYVVQSRDICSSQWFNSVRLVWCRKILHQRWSSITVNMHAMQSRQIYANDR